jgi:hypothetical protein
MSQITLRGLEPELEAAVRRLALQEGISMNKAALKLIRKGAGLSPNKDRRGINQGLADWIGSMSTEDADAIAEAVTEIDRLSIERP